MTTLNAVEKLLLALKQLICFHTPKEHWHIGKGECPEHFSTDICTRCGKVTMKSYAG